MGDMLFKEFLDESKLGLQYVLTNCNGIKGAAAILYEGILKTFSDKTEVSKEDVLLDRVYLYSCETDHHGFGGSQLNQKQFRRREGRQKIGQNYSTVRNSHEIKRRIFLSVMMWPGVRIAELKGKEKEIIERFVRVY